MVNDIYEFDAKENKILAPFLARALFLGCTVSENIQQKSLRRRHATTGVT